MENKQHDYAITPSLLDAFLRFQRNEDEETFTSLLDRINRVEHEKGENQLKGIAFEKAVNAVILLLVNHTVQPTADITVDGFTFDGNLILTIASKLQHCTSKQEYMEAIFDTHVGRIKLYGITDFGFPEMIVDLKGGEDYSFGKFKKRTQHLMYPLISITNGKPIKQFKYLVSDYRNYFIEPYTPTQNNFDKMWINVFEFIRFLNHFKKHITDTKIFGLDPVKTT